MSEEQAQALLQQLQTLEAYMANLVQREEDVMRLLQEATNAVESMKALSSDSEFDTLVPVGLGAYIKAKVQPNQNTVVNIGAGAAIEVIDMLKDELKKQLIGATVQKDKISDIVKQNLRQSISSMFDAAGEIDILSNIEMKREKGEPYIVSFMGINGTGKTTTIAKFANFLRVHKFSAVIAAADTYRAGAIEQISEHANRLNIKIIAQNYGSDPAAVARDAVLYAKSHRVDCVLIDTAGR